MDLGIRGKKALVLASSQGLGLGVATKLCEEGANVLLNGRTEDRLAAAASRAGCGRVRICRLYRHRPVRHECCRKDVCGG